MTYTDEELKLIEKSEKEFYQESSLDDSGEMSNFESAFQSEAMQSILESRIKSAKIELLEELDGERLNYIKGVIEDKLNKLKK